MNGGKGTTGLGIKVTHKQYVNPSSTMDAHLSWPDGRKLVVPAMSASKRVRIFDGVEPEITWVMKEKKSGNG